MDFLEMAIAQKLGGGGGGPAPSGTKQISITENGTTTEDVSAFASAEITVDVPTGGGGTETPENDVIFYDYDGTRVYSYSAADFANLTAMPANPDRTADGLTAQGWNWSLADAKAYVAEYGMLDIGQMYITTSGATEIDIELGAGATTPSIGLAVNGSVEIDWGDGTAKTTLSGTSLSTLKTTQSHSYAQSGKYMISIKPIAESTFKVMGQGGLPRLLYTSIDTSNTQYSNAMLCVRFGSGITEIGDSTFQTCSQLRKVSLPQTITAISSSAWRQCRSIQALVIPSQVTSISTMLFDRTSSLAVLSLPKSVTTFGDGILGDNVSISRFCIPQQVTDIPSSSFKGDYALKRVAIPNGVTSIGANAFSNDQSIYKIVLPESVTSIGGSVFAQCRALTELHVKSLTPPSLASQVFNGVANSLIIYVPAESLEAYRTATNWSTYASQIQAEPS